MNQITDSSSFALLAGEAGFDLIEERENGSAKVCHGSGGIVLLRAE
jgi:hypothetical protein